MLNRTFYAAALLAAFALSGPGFAQTPTPRSTAAPTLPAPASPTIPTRIGTPVTPVASTASGRKIDINSSGESDLSALPGIGPVTAKAIIAGRPWDDLAALTTKKVISKPTLERNKDRLALADINRSSAAEMAKTLPGIGDKTAPKIVNGRPYAMPQDLVTKNVLTGAQLAKIQPVITY